MMKEKTAVVLFNASRFKNLLVCIAIPIGIAFSSIAHARHHEILQESIKAVPTVGEDCSVTFATKKVAGDVIFYLEGEDQYQNFTERASEYMQRRDNALALHKDFNEYLAYPQGDVYVGVGNLIDGKMQIKLFDYDVDALRQDINTCIKATSGESSGDTPESPDAVSLTPAQIQQQAQELGISPDDYTKCPCGDAFAKVEMSSPPWVSNSFSLRHGFIRCSLTSLNENGKNEYLLASGTRSQNIVQCRAKMGLKSANGRVEYAPRYGEKPAYSRDVMQACYNIIGAKARQWFKQGGKIKLIYDPHNDPKKRKDLPATLENLQCPSPN